VNHVDRFLLAIHFGIGLQLKFAWSILALACSTHLLNSQDLRPRAYVITPVHSNAVILSYAFSDGSVFFGTVLPITNASGRYHVPATSYYHSLNFFKRAGNVGQAIFEVEAENYRRCERAGGGYYGAILLNSPNQPGQQPLGLPNQKLVFRSAGATGFLTHMQPRGCSRRIRTI
jgi:hypothetical protein